MTTITLTIDEKDQYIADYLKANHIDQSQLTFDQLLTVLEDAEDYAAGMQALVDHHKNPQTTSHDDIMKEFGLA